MKKKGKVVTKEMVYERTCQLIVFLEADFELSIAHSNLLKKRMELAFVLLKKLQSEKVSPALILAQLNKHFGNIVTGGKVDPKIAREAKIRITNPENLN